LEDRQLLTATLHEFPIPNANSFPFGIAAGPDGSLWFAESNSDTIGRITPTGGISEFPAGNAEPEMITSGPDGNLWFTQGNGKGQIGRITPTGKTTFFPVPTQFPGLAGIAQGPDGNLWFTESQGSANQIGRITPAGVVTEFPIPTPNCVPFGIIAGPDNALWFTESFDNIAGQVDKIGRITTSGTVTEFTIPTVNAVPTAITTGPDGNLWFDEAVANKIGRITPTGTITEFAVPAAGHVFAGLTVGADGNLYFGATNSIGQITIAGTVTEFPISASAQVEGITKGPDGNIWFTEAAANKIGQLVIQAAPPAAPDLALSGTAPASVTLGTNVTYTVTVTNNGTVAGTGVTLTDTLPAGVTFVSANDGVTPVAGVLTFNLGNLGAGATISLTIVVTPTAAGSLDNQITVGMNQTDPTPADNTLAQMTSVPPPAGVDGPRVTLVQRFGFHELPTTLVLTFNEPLDPGRAQNLNDYQIVALGRHPRTIGIGAAVYDAARQTVTLSPIRRLNFHHRFRLTVVGTGASGVADVARNLLDGQHTGRPGSDYVTIVTARNLVLPLSARLSRARGR
jgi:virginiamycin B lyase